jgi:hypothetical protein
MIISAQVGNKTLADIALADINPSALPKQSVDSKLIRAKGLDMWPIKNTGDLWREWHHLSPFFCYGLDIWAHFKTG